MAQNDTTTKILDAAEALFAEQGFTETSLRAITKQAGVNIAAVNYHFGSKKELIQAVFARFLDPFCIYLDRNLDEFQIIHQGVKPDIKAVLSVLEYTVMRAIEGKNAPHKLSVFLRLLGLSYSQSQGHMRRFLKSNYHSTYMRVIEAMRSTHPDFSEEDLFWHIHFALGSMIFTFSNLETLRDMIESNTAARTEINRILKLLIAFISGGVGQD